MAADEPDSTIEASTRPTSRASRAPSTAAGFATFYRERWFAAARWATALCGDVHRGEEIAQEAFVRIAPHYDRLDQPIAYLRRSLVNLTREQHRSATRSREREERVTRLSVVPSQDADDLPDPELFAALDHLTTTQRNVLILRYWADWDDAAIADAIGCRKGSVRSHAKRALDRLRARLENDR